jgi:hypothetical protein
MDEVKMLNAANGKSASMGGMNVAEMVAVLGEHGITITSTKRIDLNQLMSTLVSKLGLGTRDGSGAPVLVPVMPVIKKVYVPKPGNMTLIDVPDEKLLRKEGRLSAGEYYRTYGGDRVIGDICDIRKDGELKCLRARGASAYWYGRGKVDPPECTPWVKRCKL